MSHEPELLNPAHHNHKLRRAFSIHGLKVMHSHKPFLFARDPKWNLLCYQGGLLQGGGLRWIAGALTRENENCRHSQGETMNQTRSITIYGLAQ